MFSQNTQSHKRVVAKYIIALMAGMSLSFALTTLFPFSYYGQPATAQQQHNSTDKTYYSNATGASIIFHDNNITSKTSNTNNTNNTGITGFGPENSMRNMTNPMFLMKKNPLANLTNPLANLTNPLANLTIK
jgi:hypothetical protein